MRPPLLGGLLVAARLEHCPRLPGAALRLTLASAGSQEAIQALEPHCGVRLQESLPQSEFLLNFDSALVLLPSRSPTSPLRTWNRDFQFPSQAVLPGNPASTLQAFVLLPCSRQPCIPASLLSRCTWWLGSWGRLLSFLGNRHFFPRWSRCVSVSLNFVLES